MKEFVALFLVSVALLDALQYSCRNSVVCSCGQSGKNITLCLDNPQIKDDFCNQWMRCEACQDGYFQCLECAEGFVGVQCIKDLKHKRLQKRQASLSASRKESSRTLSSPSKKPPASTPIKNNQRNPGLQPASIKNKNELDCGISAIQTEEYLNGGFLYDIEAYPGEWPWVVAIAVSDTDSSTIVCSGALINSRTVLTTGHCVDDLLPDAFTLYFGKTHRQDQDDDSHVEIRQSTNIIIHQNYSSTTMDHDIALIQFSPRVRFTKRIQPICLSSEENTHLVPGEYGFVTTWGYQLQDMPNDELMKTHLAVLRTEECMKSYRKQNINVSLTKNMFCTGYGEDQLTTCHGDAGSPLVFRDPETGRYSVEGLFSFTVNGQCGIKGNYPVFTKVGRYESWIRRNAGECKDPGLVANGIRIKGDGSESKVGDRFFSGERITFRCLPQYTLHGTVSINCEDGEWTGPLPQCKKYEECGISFMQSKESSAGRLLSDPIVHPGDWPWVVAIAVHSTSRLEVICSGTLIDSRTVLTTGHCVDAGNSFIIHFGKTHWRFEDDDSEVEVRQSTRIILHPDYSNITYDNDIALIKFFPPILFTDSIQPICLPSKNTMSTHLREGEDGIVTTWGFNLPNMPPDELMHVYLPVLTNEECMESYKSKHLNVSLTRNMFCTDLGDNQLTPCYGDGGSPLFFRDMNTGRYSVEGLVSFSVTSQCGTEGLYPVFTKVGRYISWIKTNQGDGCSDPGFVTNGYRKIQNGSDSELTGIFANRESITFGCNPSYTLQGSPTIRCIDSQWSDAVPQCTKNKDCGIPVVQSDEAITTRLLNAIKTKPGEWPWVVAIAVRSRGALDIICGGALINSRTVLTAAHCTEASPLILYFGKIHRWDRNDDSEVEVRQSTEIIRHIDYSTVTYENDIAVIKFSPVVAYTDRIRPVCLPSKESMARHVLNGKTGVVTGWGQNERSLPSDELMKVHSPVITNEECMESYRSHNISMTLTDNMFCTSFGEQQQTTCEGDSGSPMVFKDADSGRYIVEGLVSFGVNRQCGQEGMYPVYTKVGVYESWIRRNEE